jgi:hypothetical protein
MKYKIAVITANFGNYDSVKDIDINNSHLFDWYYFTDNDSIKLNVWKTVTVKYHLINKDIQQYNSLSVVTNKKIYNMMCAKYYKTQHHTIDILKKYDYIIWMDSSIEIINENFIDNIINLLNNDHQLINFIHPKRNNVNNEVNVSLSMKKYTGQKIKEQLKYYNNNKFVDNTLYACGFFIRKQNKKLNKCFDEWWVDNQKWSYQDQISYPYILWKNNIIPHVIQEIIGNNTNFKVNRSTRK